METGSHFDVANAQFGNEAKKYLALIEEATTNAKSYNGSEEAFKSLMASLENLEETVVNFPSLQDVPKPDRDIAAALKFTPDNPLDIKHLLEMAIAARLSSLSNSLNNSNFEDEEEPLSNLTKHQYHRYEGIKIPSFFVVHVNGVFLPSDENTAIIAGSGSDKFEEPRFEDRISELLPILDKIGIYSDDLITMIGKNNPNSMRKQSYAAIRIPRINRTILVCNQVGEATFVIRGDVSTEELLSNSKDKLQNKLGNKIQKVEHITQNSWEKKIHDLLASDSIWDDPDKPFVPKPVGKKIDVRQFRVDDLKNKIIAHFKTPENFVNATYYDRQNFIIEGKKAVALSRIFGVNSVVTASTIHWLEFGLKIWPDNKFIIQKIAEIKNKIEDENRSLDYWFKELRNAYTPETFTAILSNDYYSLLNGRISALRLAKLFGVELKNDSFVSKPNFLLIALKIWPGNKMIEEKLEIETRPLEEWARLIKQKCTPEQWIKMGSEEKERFKIDGNIGLTYIGTVFGIVTRNIYSPKNYLDLGSKIWPDNELIKNEIKAHEQKTQLKDKIDSTSKQEILDSIRSKYGPEEWLKINRRTFDLNGLSLFNLSKKLGILDIKERPETDIGFFKLSLLIYPSNPTFENKLKDAEERMNNLKNRSVEEWRKVISHQISPENWVGSSKIARRILAFDDIKLTAIATIFGIKGNVLEKNDAYLKLGLAIWPGNELIQKKLDELSTK